MMKKSRILFFVFAGCVVLLLLAGAYFYFFRTGASIDPAAKAIYEQGVRYEKSNGLFAAVELYRRAAAESLFSS